MSLPWSYLVMKIIAVCFGNNMISIYLLRVQNAVFLCLSVW